MNIELASWLGTYWIHSTLILGSAWLLMRLIPRGSHRLRESIWKTAVVAGFATATVQSVLPLLSSPGFAEQTTPLTTVGLSSLADNPGDGSVRSQTAVGTGIDSPPAALADRAAAGATLLNEATSPHAPRYESVQVAALLPTTDDKLPALGAPSTDLSVSPSSASPSSTVWRLAPLLLWMIASAWFLGALTGSIRWMQARRQLFRRIDPRTELHSGVLYEAFQKLIRHASVHQAVRLTDSRHAPSPMALHGSEICIPADSMAALPESEQRAMLAHELGHIVRRDPFWLALSHWIETLFFFQPLNRIARKEVQREAEFLADDWALAHSEGGLVLARCLATVAGWVGAGQTRLSTVSAMAEHDSSLVDRVQRLVDGDTTPSRGIPTWVRVPMVGILCLAVILIAPRVAARSKEDIARRDILGRNSSIFPIAVALESLEGLDALRVLREFESFDLEGEDLYEFSEATRIYALARAQKALERAEYEIEFQRLDQERQHRHLDRDRSRVNREALQEMKEVDRAGQRLYRKYREDKLTPEEARRIEQKLDELRDRLREMESRLPRHSSSRMDSDETSTSLASLAKSAALKTVALAADLPFVSVESNDDGEPSMVWLAPRAPKAPQRRWTVVTRPTPDTPVVRVPRIAPTAPVAPLPPTVLEPLFPIAPSGEIWFDGDKSGILDLRGISTHGDGIIFEIPS